MKGLTKAEFAELINSETDRVHAIASDVLVGIIQQSMTKLVPGKPATVLIDDACCARLVALTEAFMGVIAKANTLLAQSHRPELVTMVKQRMERDMPEALKDLDASLTKIVKSTKERLK